MGYVISASSHPLEWDELTKKQAYVFIAVRASIFRYQWLLRDVAVVHFYIYIPTFASMSSVIIYIFLRSQLRRLQW